MRGRACENLGWVGTHQRYLHHRLCGSSVHHLGAARYAHTLGGSGERHGGRACDPRGSRRRISWRCITEFIGRYKTCGPPLKNASP